MWFLTCSHVPRTLETLLQGLERDLVVATHPAEVAAGFFFSFPSQNLGQRGVFLVFFFLGGGKKYFPVLIQVLLAVLFLRSELWDV